MKAEFFDGGGADGRCNRVPLRCAMSQPHESQSSAGEISQVAPWGWLGDHHLEGCSRPGIRRPRVAR
jgi:hypothetical protein